MSFNIETKTEMFIRCARLCCLCLRQCGTNIEAAHIVDKSAGGTDDASNGIPVCLDCHQEVGSYNDKHPKGNKFRPEELIGRRDHIYHLVETGVIYAQLIAERARSARHDKNMPPLAHRNEPPKPSEESRHFLKALLSTDAPVDAPARKLALLNEQDRAYVLDALLRKAANSTQSISAIADIVQSDSFPKEQGILLTEQLVRKLTLYGTVGAKAELLGAIPKSLLASVYRGLRLAFFEDIMGIVKRDQFVEVNKIVPALVAQVEAIPEDLHKPYVLSLLDQAGSDSYDGAPAARRALSALPEAVAKAGIAAVDTEYLSWNSRRDHVKSFAERYRHLADAKQRVVLRDLVKLSHREFVKKHLPDE